MCENSTSEQRYMYPLENYLFVLISRNRTKLDIFPFDLISAPGEIRTHGHWIRSPLLYPLSYRGKRQDYTRKSILRLLITHVIISPRAIELLKTHEELSYGRFE